jgi:hypothetical protein
MYRRSMRRALLETMMRSITSRVMRNRFWQQTRAASGTVESPGFNSQVRSSTCG